MSESDQSGCSLTSDSALLPNVRREPSTFVSNILPLLDFWLPLMFAQKKHKKKSPKNTRDLHDAHFRSLPTYFALASAACVNDCSNLIGLVMQIKVTAEFPDVHVPTDVSALGKRGRGAACRGWTHPSKRPRLKRHLNWNGLCQSTVYPLVFTTHKKKVIDIYIQKGKGKNTRTCSERGLLFISLQHSSSARGAARQRKLASERAGERDRSGSEGRRA